MSLWMPRTEQNSGLSRSHSLLMQLPERLRHQFGENEGRITKQQHDLEPVHKSCLESAYASMSNFNFRSVVYALS